MQFKYRTAAAAVAVLFSAPALAVSDAEWMALKGEIRQMKAAYEARIAELEKRVKAAETKTTAAEDKATQAETQALEQPRALSGGFNPDISMILQGQYASLGKSANQQISGFMTPEGQARRPKGFSIDGAELVFSASIDPLFKGLAILTVADEEVAVEEAWFQTLGLGNGFSLKGGRFLSAIGYQNEQHPHAWDFADSNLVYKSLFGEGYAHDGLQLKWLAPTDLFIEPFVEIGRGAGFPGADRDRNGAGAVSAGVHLGDDVGDSHSWRAGLSYLSTKANVRPFEGSDPSGVDVAGDFSGNSKVWLADFVWKWAPNGNARERNFKFATEYFRRNESGTLYCDDAGADPSTCASGLTGPYRSGQSGFYAQGVYQFMPRWRAGYRYDKLWRGEVDFNGADIGGTVATLADYDPSRHSLMLDWSPSEFSRLRLQYSKDRSMEGQNENQWFVQYIHSLGAHGAHKF